MVNHLPRGEAFVVPKMIDHILQWLVLRNVYVITDIPFCIPFVDHLSWHDPYIWVLCYGSRMESDVSLGRSV